MLHVIVSDTPFDVIFIYFWEPGYIPYWDGFRKILIYLDCMTGFGLGKFSILKEITPDQVAR